MTGRRITITKGRSVGMSELAGDGGGSALAWMKRMYPMPFMKPRQLGMSSCVDPVGFIKWNIKIIEEEVFARGGRYVPDMNIYRGGT